jgi:hypothetical protein
MLKTRIGHSCSEVVHVEDRSPFLVVQITAHRSEQAEHLERAALSLAYLSVAPLLNA